MRLFECMFTKNSCYKAGQIIIPGGIMLHSTGANNPNLRRYVQPDDGQLGVNKGGTEWNRAAEQVCVHAFIGKLADGSVASYQTLPWNFKAWHCGVGTKGISANNTHLSIEICEDGLKDASYFAAVYREAVELCAYLCKLHGFDPMKDGVLICHSEGYQRGIASNHADVMHWFPRHGKSMDTFRADVTEEMKKEEEPELNRKETEELFEQMLDQRFPVFKDMDDVPDWAQPSIQRMKDKGMLRGDATGCLNLSADLMRTLVVLDRILEGGIGDGQ